MTLLHTLGRSFPYYQFGVSCEGKLDHESYSIDHAGHIFSIKVGSPIAKYFALSRLQMALESKQLQGVLGVLKPRFSVRPLFITSTERCQLPTQLSVDLPLWFRDVQDREDLLLEKTHELLLYAFELGVNTLIFTSNMPCRETAQTSITWKQLRLFLDQIKNAGMKLGLHLVFDSKEKEISDRVKEFAQAIHVLYDVIDFIVLHQQEVITPRKDRTEFEDAKEEIQLLEAQIRKPLLYLLHAKGFLGCKQQANELFRLSRESGPNTILFFHAVVGNPFHFGVHLHPFFDVCSLQTVRSSDKIMPLLSLSEVVLKETHTLVPFVACNLIQEIFDRQAQDNLFGVGFMIKEIAPAQSLSRIVQWSIGQKMWGVQSIQALFFEGLSHFLRDWHIEGKRWLLQQLFFELDLLIRQYGFFTYGIQLQETILQDQIEIRKIEYTRLCLQFEIFTLFLKKVVHELAENEREKLEPISLFLCDVQKSFLSVIHEEAQNHSLKIPATITAFKVIRW